MKARLAVPLLVAVTLVAVTLAGCGGPSAIGTGASAAASTAGTAPSMAPMPSMSMPSTGQPPTAAAAASSTVDIQNFAFSPVAVTVRAGTTVTWTNKDGEPHTVTERNKAFASPVLSSGQSYSHTFTTPGSYSYLCTIHPFMVATVVVTP